MEASQGFSLSLALSLRFLLDFTSCPQPETLRTFPVNSTVTDGDYGDRVGISGVKLVSGHLNIAAALALVPMKRAASEGFGGKSTNFLTNQRDLAPCLVFSK